MDKLKQRDFCFVWYHVILLCCLFCKAGVIEDQPAYLDLKRPIILRTYWEDKTLLKELSG